MKLPYDKFSQEPSLATLTLIVRMRFHKINFHNCHKLQTYFYNENFQIYGDIIIIIITAIIVKLLYNVTKISTCIQK